MNRNWTFPNDDDLKFLDLIMASCDEPCIGKEVLLQTGTDFSGDQCPY